MAGRSRSRPGNVDAGYSNEPSDSIPALQRPRPAGGGVDGEKVVLEEEAMNERRMERKLYVASNRRQF